MLSKTLKKMLLCMAFILLWNSKSLLIRSWLAFHVHREFFKCGIQLNLRKVSTGVEGKKLCLMPPNKLTNQKANESFWKLIFNWVIHTKGFVLYQYNEIYILIYFVNLCICNISKNILYKMHLINFCNKNYEMSVTKNPHTGDTNSLDRCR